MDVLSEFFAADFPDAVTQDFALFGAVESEVEEKFSVLVCGEIDAVALAGLIFHCVFALDVDGRFFLDRLEAFRRVLAPDGVALAFEIPEAHVAADFFARTGNIECGIVDKCACAVVEYELVTPGLVEFLGVGMVGHEVVRGEVARTTRRGGDIASPGGSDKGC